MPSFEGTPRKRSQTSRARSIDCRKFETRRVQDERQGGSQRARSNRLGSCRTPSGWVGNRRAEAARPEPAARGWKNRELVGAEEAAATHVVRPHFDLVATVEEAL